MLTRVHLSYFLAMCLSDIFYTFSFSFTLLSLCHDFVRVRSVFIVDVANLEILYCQLNYFPVEGTVSFRRVVYDEVTKIYKYSTRAFSYILTLNGRPGWDELLICVGDSSCLRIADLLS